MTAFPAVSRRMALGLLVSGLASGMTGCAGVIAGRGPVPSAAQPPYAGPYRLRIAIFEIRRLRLPFHAGMLIDAPQGRILFDPAGVWHDDACTRHHDVHYPIDDTAAEDWLSRGGLQGLPGRWVLHLFEIEVDAATAAQAHALALGRRPSPAFGCVWSVSSLLSGLPGFAGIRPQLSSFGLLRALQSRDDLTYTTRPVPVDGQ